MKEEIPLLLSYIGKLTPEERVELLDKTRAMWCVVCGTREPDRGPCPNCIQ